MADPQIRSIIRGLERVTERVVTKITLDVVANLVETTRVDTGWARANWLPSIGRPREESLSGITPTPQAAQARAQEQAAATATLPARYSLRDGSTFVTNNVPYVPRLNTVLDPGFVQRAVDKAVRQDIRGFEG